MLGAHTRVRQASYRTLTSSQDTNSPNIHGYRTEFASEEDTAAIDVSRHGLGIVWEKGTIAVIVPTADVVLEAPLLVGSATSGDLAYHICVGLPV